MTTNDGTKRARLSESERQLAERLREVMGDRCVTEYARSLDLNHESVRRYIRGMTPPSAKFLIRVTERYRVDANWLLTGERLDNADSLRTVETAQLVAELERRDLLGRNRRMIERRQKASRKDGSGVSAADPSDGGDCLPSASRGDDAAQRERRQSTRRGDDSVHFRVGVRDLDVAVEKPQAGRNVIE